MSAPSSSAAAPTFTVGTATQFMGKTLPAPSPPPTYPRAPHPCGTRSPSRAPLSEHTSMGVAVSTADPALRTHDAVRACSIAGARADVGAAPTLAAPVSLGPTFGTVVDEFPSVSAPSCAPSPASSTACDEPPGSAGACSPSAGDFSASSVEKVTRYGVRSCPSSHLVPTSSSHAEHLRRRVTQERKRAWPDQKC